MRSRIQLHSRGEITDLWPLFRIYYGPESIAERFMTWCAERAIELRYIEPGKPDQNAFIERYNRTYRTEVSNAYVFESLGEVREISAEWVQSYHEERPHDALAGLPPATYRAQLEGTSPPKTTTGYC
jgi:putative transposase